MEETAVCGFFEPENNNNCSQLGIFFEQLFAFLPEMQPNSKSTLVIGASENPYRYSWMAVNMLKEYGHKVHAIGIRPGNVNGVEILTGYPVIENLHTISLYVGAQHQPNLYSYILSLNPVRVIFNPGTENPELVDLLINAGVAIEEACTLVLLRTGLF